MIGVKIESRRVQILTEVHFYTFSINALDALVVQRLLQLEMDCTDQRGFVGFYIALIHSGKFWIKLFSFQL